MCIRVKIKKNKSVYFNYKKCFYISLQADHTQWFDNHEQNEKSRTSESFSDRVTILLPEVINDLNQKGFDTNSIAETTQS